MISTNWIMGLLVDVFGQEFARKGKLRTKYIAPIYEDQVVISCARVTAIDDRPTARPRIDLEVWCEDDTAKKLTVGEATASYADRRR